MGILEVLRTVPLPSIPCPTVSEPLASLIFISPLSAINSKTHSALVRVGAMRQWRLERGWDPNNPARRFFSVEACEHIVVLNKRDLVPEWGLEVVVISLGLNLKINGVSPQPFRKAMESKFPHQQLLLTCWKKARDVRNLMDVLVSRSSAFSQLRELTF